MVFSWHRWRVGHPSSLFREFFLDEFGRERRHAGRTNFAGLIALRTLPHSSAPTLPRRFTFLKSLA